MSVSTELSNTTFQKDRFILASLVGKDFKRKYRRSVLGVVWSVLNPFLMMLVLTAVFSVAFKFDVENFALYLILGQVVFNFMANSTNGALVSIIDSSGLIKKVRVNKMVFPLEKVVFELVNLGLSLIPVLAVMAWFRIMPTLNILFLPLLLIYLILFCSGLALAVSALAVFFRDVVHLWTVLITAWTYATPLFYPIEALPAWFQPLMQFNPMYHFVTYFRMIVMWGETPGLRMNLVCLVMALVTFIAGALVFSKTQKKFILYV